MIPGRVPDYIYQLGLIVRLSNFTYPDIVFEDFLYAAKQKELKVSVVRSLNFFEEIVIYLSEVDHQNFGVNEKENEEVSTLLNHEVDRFRVCSACTH